MRIDRLDLSRFGCFTDRSLDLSATGTHLVVGPNEAGKTTAMAAIRQLLFGIPVRSAHAFVHELRDLRLGAVLRGEGGELLEITRVKRQTDTLRGPEDEVIDEAELARLLHDVSEAVYGNLFTIGHDEIVLGSKALLESDGELGRALFSASRGTSDLSAVLRKLDERAAGLFKSAASRPVLNAAIRSYKGDVAEVARHSKSAAAVMGLEEELDAAQRAYERTAADRTSRAERRAQLERVQRARPQLATRSDLVAEKEEIERRGPLVNPTIGETLASARAEREAGKAQLSAAQAVIERLDGSLAALVVDGALLGQSDEIDRLQAESGGYRQNISDLPGLVARAGALERELDRLGRGLPGGCPLGDDGRPALTVDEEERIRQLADRHTRLEAQLEEAADQVDETRGALEARQKRLEELGEPAEPGLLAEVATRVRGAGDLEAARTAAARRLAEVEADLASSLSALGLDACEPRAVDALAVPSLETIREHRAELERRAGDAADLEREAAGLDSRRAEIESDLAELLGAEQPPREDDLFTARGRRDEGWRLVRRLWLDAASDSGAVESWSRGEPLPDAYEAAVATADDVADRLRDGAKAVERRASLEEQLEGVRDLLAARRQDLVTAQSEQGEAESSWSRLWEPLGIVAHSPAEMERWRDEFRECAQRSVEARRLVGEIEGLDETIARHRADLVSALASAGRRAPNEATTLLGLLDCADEFVAAVARARQERADSVKAVTEGEERLRRSTAASTRREQAMAEWRREWAEAVAAVGLDATASPDAADAVLKVLDDINDKQDGLDDLRRRIDGIERRNESFAQRAAAVLRALEGHEDLADVGPDRVVATLASRLGDARKVATEHATTLAERERHDRDRIDAELRVDEAGRRIERLVAEAGMADEARLEQAIGRSSRHADLVGEIAGVEESLRASGFTIGQIEDEASEMAGVEIGPEIEALAREIDTLDEGLEVQGQLVGELRTRRSLVDASGEAADAMVRAQQTLAAIAADAEEYVQVVLAKRLLEEQIAAYREEHQGPLLARARELFRVLTMDAYVGLDTDTDAKGDLELLARSAADRLLKVDALSTGTRDQLYLALRIAALEQFMSRRGPLPLVLDDLFVHFDDRRTSAGLEVVDQVADLTQVLLFTHHERVADQAAEAIGASRLTIHRLA